MKRSRGKHLNQEMNFTNLVDVVFVLLITYMVTAPIMSQGIKVDLPQAEAPTMEQEKLVKVSVDRSGNIFIADMGVELNDFEKVFQGMWDHKAPVVVNADQKVDYGRVMQVVSALQQAGVAKLGFLTMDPSPDSEK